MFTLFQKRYGAEFGRVVPDNNGPTNDFIDKILGRSTMRKFLNTPIPEGLTERLIACAQSSPTSSMLQPWSVVSIDKENRKIFYEKDEYSDMLGMKPSINKLGNDFGKPADPLNKFALLTAPLFLIWLVDLSIMDKICTDSSLDQIYPDKGETRQAASECLTLCGYEMRAVIDAIIAAQTFSCAAESAGLGTMYMGGFRYLDLKELLKLPDHVMPLFGMCVGYSAYKGAEKPRLPQELIFHHNQYKVLNFDLLKTYNNTASNFYKKFNMGGDWFSRIFDRTYPTKQMFTYKNLLEKYGFYFNRYK